MSSDFIPFDSAPPLSWWRQRIRNFRFWRELARDRVLYYVPVVWLHEHKLFEWAQLCVICEWRFTWPPSRCVCRHCLKG